MCVTELLVCKMYVENNQGTHLICFKFHKNNTNTNENNLNFTNQTFISDKQEKERDSWTNTEFVSLYVKREIMTIDVVEQCENVTVNVSFIPMNYKNTM